MVDSQKINEVVKKIATGFNPEKIFLFGSYANGTQNEQSDLDLLIIQESDLPIQNRGLDIRLSLIGNMIPMDIIVYTKSEFEQEMKSHSSFIYSSFKNAKLMYEQ